MPIDTYIDLFLEAKNYTKFIETLATVPNSIHNSMSPNRQRNFLNTFLT